MFGESIDFAVMAMWFVAFLFSTTCHEAAHAWAALRGGDPTAYHAGQVSLNPLPHIRREPFGMIVVPVLAFLFAGFMIGWASAPYDPRWAARHPKRAGLMAAAGPAANLALATLAILALRVVVGLGGAESDPLGPGLRVATTPGALLGPELVHFLMIMALLNALLGVFNLMPLPPLDGASVLESFGGSLGQRFVTMMRELPFAGLIGLVIAWRLFGAIAEPLFVFVASLAR